MSHLVDAALALTAFTFLWSGASKLKSPVDAAIAAANFGIVKSVNRSVGQVAGLIELSIGIASLCALITGNALTAIAALLSALFAISAFTFLIARSLSRGESFACNCFGRTSAEPISRVAILRNLLLLVLPSLGLAVLVAYPDLGQPTTMQTVITAAIVVSSVTLLHGVSLMVRAGRDPFGADMSRWQERTY